MLPHDYLQSSRTGNAKYYTDLWIFSSWSVWRQVWRRSHQLWKFEGFFEGICEMALKTAPPEILKGTHT